MKYLFYILRSIIGLLFFLLPYMVLFSWNLGKTKGWDNIFFSFMDRVFPLDWLDDNDDINNDKFSLN